MTVSFAVGNFYSFHFILSQNITDTKNRKRRRQEVAGEGVGRGENKGELEVGRQWRKKTRRRLVVEKGAQERKDRRR